MILMLTDKILGLGLVVLQVIILQFGLFPVDRKDLVIEIRVVNDFADRNILHQVAQALSDMFKL